MRALEKDQSRVVEKEPLLINLPRNVYFDQIMNLINLLCMDCFLVAYKKDFTLDPRQRSGAPEKTGSIHLLPGFRAGRLALFFTA